MLKTLAIVVMIGAPPPAYDHEPVIPYQVKTVSPDEMLEWCGVIPDAVQFGCWNEWSATIYLRDDMTPAAHRYALRHEIGHVNGWRH